MNNANDSGLASAPLMPAMAAFASIGIGKTKAYEILNSGAVTAVKLGNKTLIRTADWSSFINGLPAYRPANARAA